MFCLPTTGVSVCTSVTGFANALRCLEMSVRKRRASHTSAPRQGVTQQSRLFALAAPLGLPDRAFSLRSITCTKAHATPWRVPVGRLCGPVRGLLHLPKLPNARHCTCQRHCCNCRRGRSFLCLVCKLGCRRCSAPSSIHLNISSSSRPLVRLAGGRRGNAEPDIRLAGR